MNARILFGGIVLIVSAAGCSKPEATASVPVATGEDSPSVVMQPTATESPEPQSVRRATDSIRDASEGAELRKVWSDGGDVITDVYFPDGVTVHYRHVKKPGGSNEVTRYEKTPSGSEPSYVWYYPHADGPLGREGPCSFSGKRHGVWKTYSRSGDVLRTSHRWYWYGETVSEGEWNLRNK
jgi:hypothetical protein